MNHSSNYQLLLKLGQDFSLDMSCLLKFYYDYMSYEALFMANDLIGTFPYKACRIRDTECTLTVPVYSHLPHSNPPPPPFPPAIHLWIQWNIFIYRCRNMRDPVRPLNVLSTEAVHELF